MSIFLYEFFYFLSASLAILVSISSTVLFYIAFRKEKKMQTGWRALGFLILSGAFLFFIVERKNPSVNIFALTVQALAYFMILRGVSAEPKLLHLKQIPSRDDKKTVGKVLEKKIVKKIIIFIITFIALTLVIILPGYLYIKTFLASILELTALCFISITILLQIKRYQKEKEEIKNKEHLKQDIYPLVAYCFLFIRSLAMIFYRIPESDIVLLRKLSLEYSAAWIIALIATFVAFIYLGIWAWNFIKVRPFLRTYVSFISAVILVATLGALLFTIFIFKIVERNNLDLMLKGAETQGIVMNDRSNTATFVTKLAAADPYLIKSVAENNYTTTEQISQNYLQSSGVDIFRIYNSSGEITNSPSDPRDKGKVLSNDSLVAYSITGRRMVRTFDTLPGVLSDFIVVRAVHPIIDGTEVVGAVEAGYKFDNAFVDFSKENTNLDVTVYTGKKISATTIKTLDGVSRFIGSEETGYEIIKNVFEIGTGYTTTTDRFNEIYYSAFNPIRNTNGEIIGMISVGTPAFSLREATRQTLLTTFIIIITLSSFVSLLGYYAIPGVTLKKQ